MENKIKEILGELKEVNELLDVIKDAPNTDINAEEISVLGSAAYNNLSFKKTFLYEKLCFQIIDADDLMDMDEAWEISLDELCFDKKVTKEIEKLNLKTAGELADVFLDYDDEDYWDLMINSIKKYALKKLINNEK